MRCSCGFFSLPRQYAAALRISLNAGMRRVVGRCGPRHRSVQTRSPDLASRLSYMVSPPAPTSVASSPLTFDFSPISSSLNFSSASSVRASSSSMGRRAKRWPALMMSAIFFSMAARSSGVNGRAGRKS